jgi:hypothetical protein
MPSQPWELNEARGLIGGRELIEVLRYIRELVKACLECDGKHFQQLVY